MIVYNDDFKKFHLAVKEAVKKVDDLSPALKEMGKSYIKSREFIFLNKGPGLYKDLKPSYKKQKAKKTGSAYPILKWTGRLAKSITKEGGENIFEVSKRTLAIGTRVPYGIFHQSLAPRKVLPRRPFLFWGPESPRTVSLPQSKKIARKFSVQLLTFVNREMGKSLKASIDSAIKETTDVFDKY